MTLTKAVDQTTILHGERTKYELYHFFSIILLFLFSEIIQLNCNIYFNAD